MRHVLALRKIILIFGFALAVFGCDMNKVQLSDTNEAVYTYSANGELLNYSEYEYDSNGKLTKRSDYNADGELYSYTVYLY